MKVMQWTIDQVLALAPDESSVAASRKLVSLNKWQGLGRSEIGAWGECQGSGSKPYQVRVDLREAAYKCSCPSRKIPCKHALALFQLVITKEKEFSQGTPPAWASEWFERRSKKQEERAAGGEAKKKAEADPQAQAKRLEARKSKSREGMSELSLRMRDILREGLAEAPAKPYKFWDDAARRLIDAQAPGAARRVRQLPEYVSEGGSWPERVLKSMSRLALAASALERFDELDPALQAEVASFLGWTISKDEVFALPGQSDSWTVLGVVLDGDDELRLQVRKTWLWGEASRKPALILDFAHGQQPFAEVYAPGSAFEAELVYCPGAIEYRAFVKQRGDARARAALSGYGSIDEALSAYAGAMAACPWLEEFPVVLENVLPVHHEDQWSLVDAHNHEIPLHGDAQVLWRLLAESGGHPVAAFGVWADSRLMLLPPDRPYTLPKHIPAAQSQGPLSELARSVMMGANGNEPVLPHCDGALGEALGRLKGDAEAKVLHAAALFAAHAEAGWEPQTATGSPLPRASEDVGEMLARSQEAVLTEILCDSFDFLLPELVELAASRGFCCPHRHLPGLLSAGESYPEVYAPLTRFAGVRGRWLAACKEDWSYVLRTRTENADVPDNAAWEEGSLLERVAFLAHRRKVDPGGARTLLEEGLKDCSADEREAFVETLQIGLSADDEAFLEMLLRDRSRKVIEAACELLARIPGSSFSQRMRQRLQGCVTKERGMFRAKLGVEPPELGADAFADGIQEKSPASTGLGQKAWWLAQLTAKTPLAFWDTLGLRPAELIKLARKSDWYSALVYGWRRAAARESHSEWLQALLGTLDKDSTSEERESLLAALPAVDRERTLTSFLSSSRSELDFPATAKLLLTLPMPWGESLGKAVLAWMREGTRKDFYLNAAVAPLRELAAAIPASLFPGALKGWPEDSEHWQYFTRDDANFFHTLQLRARMHEEFKG